MPNSTRHRDARDVKKMNNKIDMHNMGYDLRSKGYKGISPLIAAVLLIAITVAIATLVSGWISTITRGTQVTVENKTSEAVECAAAAVSIDNVYIVGNNSVRIVVRNSGQANDLEVTNVTAINTTGSVFSFGTSQPVLTDFDRGEAFTFVINASGITLFGTQGNTCLAFSKAIVTTNCGGVSAVFDKTPRCA